MEESPININKHKTKCLGVWKWLGEPVDDCTSTDTKDGEMATLMENVLGILSPKGNCENNGRTTRSFHSDQQHIILSDDSRRSRGYSSDSLWSSSCSTNGKSSKCRWEHKAGRMSSTKASNKLDVPEATTPHQSPQQKQLKMTDLEACATMHAPTRDEPLPYTRNHLSSQVSRVQMPEQDLLHSALQ